jgi:hypothetical protein
VGEDRWDLRVEKEDGCDGPFRGLFGNLGREGFGVCCGCLGGGIMGAEAGMGAGWR